MVVDTSVLLAILLGEQERAEFRRLLLQHEPKISAGTLIETLRVVQLSLGPEGHAGVDALLETTGAEIVPSMPIRSPRPGKACFSSVSVVAKNRLC
jgi:uncharacterized protein with PIN domain